MARRWRAVLAAVCAAGFGAGAWAPLAMAAGSTIHVETAGADTPACGSTASPCATIPYAFNVRAVTGDTIEVGAGTFDADGSATSSFPFLMINKSDVTFLGAQAGKDARNKTPGGAGQTIVVDNNPSPAASQNFYINADGITVDGFTFENNKFGGGIQSNNTVSGWTVQNDIFFNNRIGLYAASNGTSPVTVRHNLFLSNNNGSPNGWGIYDDLGLRNAVIDASKFRDNDSDAIQFAFAGFPSSDVTIENNDADTDSSIELFETSNATITHNSLVGGTGSGVAISGGDHHITISHNVIANRTSDGVRIVDDLSQFLPPGADEFNSDVTVADNTLSGETKDGVDIRSTTGVTVRHNLITAAGLDGIAFTIRTDPENAQTSGARITQNTILGSKGSDSGIDVALGEYTGPMLIRFNRIVFSASGHGLVNDDPAVPIDARWNWWGCNTMPSGTGCDHVVGPAMAQVTFDPWLVLGIVADPSNPGDGRAAMFSSSLRHDNHGALQSGPFFDPVHDIFSAVTGTVTPKDVVTDALIQDHTTWPAGQAAPTKVCSHVDNQTVCLTFHPVLPVTGAPTLPLAATGLGLVALGAALLGVRSRRRPWRRSHPSPGN